MPDAAPASRRRRRSLDARLLIGVGLVLASVAGVIGIVSATDRRVTVFAAATALRPGDRIEAGDLIARQVSLDGADALYLAPGDIPAGGLVVGDVVRDGELVPRSAVGTRDGRRSTSIVLELSGRVSAAVEPGAAVDIWSAPAAEGTTGAASGFGAPLVLVGDAVVVRVVDDDGIVAAAEGDAVEVLVPRGRIARLLQAIANGDALAVVPAGIPLDGS